MGQACGCGKKEFTKEEEDSLIKIQGACRTHLAKKKKEQKKLQKLRAIFSKFSLISSLESN